jgi:flagellar hook assembly protein FlgD
VTPTSGGVGEVCVPGFLYYPGGELVRETGGIAMIVEAEEQSGVGEDATGPMLVLAPSRPNPVGPQASRATIAFAIPTEDVVDLRLFDVNGRLVRTLYAGRCPAGRHEIAWEGNDDRDLPVSNGVYFCQLAYGRGQPLARSIVVMR